MTAVKEAVREFRAGGGFYDDDAVRFVADKLGVEPDTELSRACYDAKQYLRDEEALATLNEYRSEGFERFSEIFIRGEGERYEIRRATIYCGRIIPDYSGPVTGRMVRNKQGIFLLPKGHRTNGYRLEPWDLVRRIR